MGSGRVTVRHPGQRAPRGPVVVPTGRVPGAARVRDYEPRARAPRLLRFRDRLEKRPKMSRMSFLYPKTGRYVKTNVTGGDASFRSVHCRERPPRPSRRLAYSGHSTRQCRLRPQQRQIAALPRREAKCEASRFSAVIVPVSQTSCRCLQSNGVIQTQRRAMIFM